MEAHCRLRALPPAFTFAQARQGGLSERNLRELRELGRLETLARGIYLRSGAADLLQIAARTPEATLCLRSALARHELIDDIPFKIDLALPRGKRRPATTAPARWHHFDADTFHLRQGRLSLAGGLSIGLYSPERCIVDAFRLRRDFADAWTLSRRQQCSGDNFQAALHAVAEHRGAELEPLLPALDGMPELVQRKWSTWRARQALPVPVPERFAELLEDLVALTTAPLTETAGGCWWSPAQLAWQRESS